MEICGRGGYNGAMSNFTPSFWRMTSGFLAIIAIGVVLIVLISVLDSKDEPADFFDQVDIIVE